MGGTKTAKRKAANAGAAGRHKTTANPGVTVVVRTSPRGASSLPPLVSPPAGSNHPANTPAAKVSTPNSVQTPTVRTNQTATDSARNSVQTQPVQTVPASASPAESIATNTNTTPEANTQTNTLPVANTLNPPPQSTIGTSRIAFSNHVVPDGDDGVENELSLVLSAKIKKKYFQFRKFPGIAREERRMKAWSLKELKLSEISDRHWHVLKTQFTKTLRSKRSTVTLEMKDEFLGKYTC